MCETVWRQGRKAGTVVRNDEMGVRGAARGDAVRIGLAD